MRIGKTLLVIVAMLLLASIIALPCATVQAETSSMTSVKNVPVVFTSIPTLSHVETSFSFDELILFPRFDSSLGTLLGVELNFQIQLNRTQTTTDTPSCSNCDFVESINNWIYIEYVIMEVSTPQLSSSRHWPNPLIGFNHDCEQAVYCNHSENSPANYNAEQIFISNPINLQDFIGSGDFDVHFFGRVKHWSNSGCGEHLSIFCSLPGVHCWQPSLDCGGTGSADASMTWTGRATVIFHYAPAVVGGFICADPVANAGGPYTGTVGTPITFDAGGSYTECSDPSSGAFFGIILYEWDFDGDGTFDAAATVPTIEHTYGSEFHGNVILRVTDSRGTGHGIPTATDFATVDVTAQLLGDIDDDGDVDMDDLALLQAAFGSRPGDTNWNANADLDNDGVVGISDLMILRGILNP